MEAYHNLCLSFRLRCSPTILMVGLSKFLIMDACDDPDSLKKLKCWLYSLTYIDNGAATMNNSVSELQEIFNRYKFELQQFTTNNERLQTEIDKNVGSTTPDTVKLFALNWNRVMDCIYAPKLELNVCAKNKRKSFENHCYKF